MDERYVEIEPANLYENVSNIIEAEFASNDSLKIEIKPFETSARVEIQFTQGPDEIYLDENRIAVLSRKLDKIFLENQIELTRFLGKGDWALSYVIDRKFIAGKINWRRWLPYPKNMAQEDQDLLDEVSEFIKISDEIDTIAADLELDLLGRFDMYVKLARKEGLINEVEQRRIQYQYHKLTTYMSS
ncbi:MAG: hypothetical protein WCO09_04805 [bacterium]